MSERLKGVKRPAEAALPKTGEFVPDPSVLAPTDKGRPAQDIRGLVLGGKDGVTLLTPPRVESIVTRPMYKRNGEGPFAATINTCNDSCTPASCDNLCPPQTGSDCNGKDC